MIQRIQTLLLASIVVLVGIFLSVNIVKATSEDGKSVTLNAFTETLIENGKETQSTKFFIAAFAILVAGTVIYNIFQYSNRRKQMLIGLITSLLCFIWLGLTMWQAYSVAASISAPPAYQKGLFIPAACMLLNTMASKFIRRDEKLVNDADRLR